MAATLLISVGSGVIAAYAGLSMALGAFIAGLLLAETEYRRAVEAMIEPFSGLLLGVFFFSVGMHIDLALHLARSRSLVAAAVVGHDRRQDRACSRRSAACSACRGPPAVETSLLLAPGGEFAFIGIGLAVQVGLVASGVAAGVLAVVSLTMGVLPFIALFAPPRRPALRAKAVPAEPGLRRAAARRPRQARHRRRPRPGRPAGLRPAGEARHRLHRRRPRPAPGGALARARPADLLRRCRQSAVPETLRHRRGAGRDRHHSTPRRSTTWCERCARGGPT